MAFRQSVSIAMGTALQHLADSLFVHLSNLILIRRDAYLDHVKTGIKQDTMNLLCNASLFGYLLLRDAAICTVEQDIIKHESSGVAQGPGLGAPQHTSLRSTRRYRPYEHKERKPTGSTDQTSQQQPWRQLSRNRSRGHESERGANPDFSKSRRFKPYK